eukprot:SAG11_NODE_1068_length_5979_cov_9.282653_4_plen_86_part_00
MSLEGATAASFRTVLKRDRRIKYADAISFLQSKSHSRDSRKDLFKQMENLKQGSGERMDNFLSRAAQLRARCANSGIKTNNFHFR